MNSVILLSCFLDAYIENSTRLKSKQPKNLLHLSFS